MERQRMGETCLDFCWGCNVHRWVWLGFFHTTSNFGVHGQQPHTWLDSMILKVLPNLDNSMIVWLKHLLFLSVHSTYIWPHSLGLGSRTKKRSVQSGLDVKSRGAVLQASALCCLGYDCNRAGKQINSATFISKGSVSVLLKYFTFKSC